MTPGWYPHPDGTGRLMFHNGNDWVDPFVEFEDNAASVMIPALERVFQAGFEAGVESAAKLYGVTLGFR
jgi:hypothetical protein